MCTHVHIHIKNITKFKPAWMRCVAAPVAPDAATERVGAQRCEVNKAVLSHTASPADSPTHMTANSRHPPAFVPRNAARFGSEPAAAEV